VGRRGIKEFRAPEALALIAADRDHLPLVCPSCGTRTIHRCPAAGPCPPPSSSAGGAHQLDLRHLRPARSYIARGLEPPRDATMDPREV